MTFFRFLQISDVHLCIVPKRRNAVGLFRRRPSQTIDALREAKARNEVVTIAQPESFETDVVSGVAKFAWVHSKQIDCIVISGDLATTGLQVDAEVADRYISAAADNMFFTQDWVTLKPCHHDIILLAGNHDNYKNDEGEPGGMRNFELRFGRWMPNHTNYVSHRIIKKGEGSAERRLGLILADFSLRSDGHCKPRAGKRFLRYGQGKAYPDAIDELVARSYGLREKYSDVYIVWIVHFAPFYCGNTLRLIEFDELISAANSMGVSEIVCGHTHKKDKISQKGVTVYCSGPSGAVGAPESTYIHLHEINIEDKVDYNRRDFRWHPEKNIFIEDSLPLAEGQNA